MVITMEEKPAEENPSGGGGGGSSERKRKRKRKLKLTWTMKMTRKITMKWRRKKKENNGRNSIRGDILCAEEFGKKFLVCAADHTGEEQRIQVVSIEEYLRDKSVGLLFAEIESYDDLSFLSALKDIYDQLRHDFEIVFVPKKKKKIENLDADAAMDIYIRNRDLFYSHLMRMPWPAVPFEDLTWREHLYKRYHIRSRRTPDLLLFDPQGRPLRKYSTEQFQELLYIYGPKFYPFTEARTVEVDNQYLAPLRSSKPSFEALLGSGNRDYLISFAADDYDDGKIKHVPISQLQGKVVGIYLFYDEGGVRQNHEELMQKLEDFRIRAGGNFEIVFVNVDYFSGFQSETSFHNFLKKRPWLLALPFKDDKIRALSTTLTDNLINPLVIVGVAGDTFFIDMYGYHVIEKYGFEACVNVIEECGFEAYPFTRDIAVKIEKKRLTTQLKLADIFKLTKTEFLIYNGEEPEPKLMPVSFLTNKKVLLYVAYSVCNCNCNRHLRKLHDLKIKDPSFQVIFKNSPINEHFSAIIPNDWHWLAFPPDEEHWIYEIFKFEFPCCHFIAFDDTGKLLKMGNMDLVRIDGNDAAFPFATDETFDKVLRDILLHKNEWNMEAGKVLLI